MTLGTVHREGEARTEASALRTAPSAMDVVLERGFEACRSLSDERAGVQAWNKGLKTTLVEKCRTVGSLLRPQALVIYTRS